MFIISSAPTTYIGRRYRMILTKKYIEYNDTKIYALFYAETKTIYYNLCFTHRTKIIIFK